MVKGYGSTNRSDEQPPPITPPRRNLSASSYETPSRTGGSLPRNQSNSAETTRTQESDPLLGEKLLISDVDDVKVNLSKSLKPRSSGFESAPDLGRGRTPKRESSPVDSLIGNNVMVFDELDTLAYSYEQDDSTLRHFLEDVQEQRRGFLNRFFGSDPALPLVCLGLVVGISICAIPAFLYVQYHHHQDVHTIMSGDDTVVKTSAAHSALWGGVPYQKISRAAYGDPVSNFLDDSLFHPSLLYQGEGIDITSAKSSVKAQNTDESMHSTIGDDDDRRLASSSMKPFLRFPFPTGAFWTNLVLLPQTYDGKPKPSTKSQSSYPIVAYPYSFQWSPLGRLQVSYSASRRKIQSNSIQDAFAPDVSIGSVDNIHTRHVVKYDSLSVTLRYYGDAKETSGKQNSTNLDEMKHWDTYIVQGSPYVTARYYGLRPELTALSDFTDISCPPTMQTEEERLTRKQSNSTHSNRRRMSIFSQPSSPAATGTSGKKFGVCGISEKSTRQKKVITGVQFVVTTQEGLMWLVFASEPITFEFEQAARRNIKTSMPFQGVIRLALVPPPPTNVSNVTASAPLDMKQLASSSGVKRLIYHAGTFPVGGTVNWSFRSGSRAPLASSMASGRRSLRQLSSSTKENNIGSVTFTFSTMHMSSLESASSSAQMELLMLSLPHHAASISSADKILFNPQDFDLFFRCIKGRMVPVVGSSWTYEEKLTSIGFDDETSIDGIQNPGLSVSTLDQSIRDLILQTVDSDLNINLPVLESGAYGFGKGIARLAQLAIIADSIEGANVHGKHTTAKNVTTAKDDSHVTKPTTPSSSTTSQRAYALLEKYLTMWLVGDGSDRRLFYDVDLGGIVSKDGLKDVFSDFGNVRYNDHHFHYGYVLYAAAVLGRAKPTFVSQYGSYVDSLFYDVAHNSSSVMNLGGKSEIFFPFARHKSWFDGHSFASGLFPFADGKSQESSSEATNCYFSAYLWSKVRWAGSPEGDKIVDYARLLLATEITGAKTYWHMTPRSINPFTATSGSSNLLPVPYNTIFQQNYMVGNLGMTDVTSTTWFGTEVVYVHLINFLPVTAITSELFDKAYVKGERQVLINTGSVEKAWTGYLISNEAIIDPNKAWTEAQSLVSQQIDSGSSKSQVLYWISTRPGFLSSTTAVVPDNDNQSSANPLEDTKGVVDTASTGSASCSAHDNCVKSGLVGLCCPTNDGTMLSCCN